MKQPSHEAYKQAGVDVDAGHALVEAIKPAATRTKRAGSMSALGGFGAFFDPKAAGFTDPLLVATTDGVGTKLKLAITTGQHDTIGQDLVAMCVNDLIVQGAEPLFFLDYYATGALDVAQGATIVRSIANACAASGCALIGGETAEMPGLYAKDDYDLAGFAVGAVERGQQITGAGIAAGNAVIGLASSGVHSNGFSLVRRIIDASGLSLAAPCPWAPTQTLGHALLTPTRLYIQSLLSLFLAVKRPLGLAHITGGGLIDNIPRILPDHLGVILDATAWALPPVFQWLKKIGALSDYDLARTFNCGIGMVVIAHASDAAAIVGHLNQAGEQACVIGHVTTTPESGMRVTINDTHTAWIV